MDDTEQLIYILKNIKVPKEDSLDFYKAIQHYKGYEFIHSFAKQLQNGKTMSSKQITQIKRLSKEINKAKEYYKIGDTNGHN